MTLSRRAFLTGGLTATTLLGLQLRTALAQERKPTITVYKSPS